MYLVKCSKAFYWCLYLMQWWSRYSYVCKLIFPLKVKVNHWATEQVWIGHPLSDWKSGDNITQPLHRIKFKKKKKKWKLSKRRRRNVSSECPRVQHMTWTQKLGHSLLMTFQCSGKREFVEWVSVNLRLWSSEFLLGGTRNRYHDQIRCQIFIVPREI